MNALDAIVANEAVLRMGAFALVLLVLALAERRWPARADARPARRQATNLALVVIDSAVLRLAFPLLAVGLALQVHAAGGGLFGVLGWPLGLEVLLAVIAFDMAIYWQHRAMHTVPLLWRLHRVHHCDTAFDITTGVRFHPLEIGLSMAFKLALVALLGPHPAAVVIFEVLLAASSLFSHADFAFAPRFDRALRTVLVTPSMHRIHHSVRRDETDSNYGTLLSMWDRAFRSYRARPVDDERLMPIGLTQWRDPAALGLGALLLQPFKRPPSCASTTTSAPFKDPPDA